jgi:hypothetical protein
MFEGDASKKNEIKKILFVFFRIAESLAAVPGSDDPKSGKVPLYIRQI